MRAAATSAITSSSVRASDFTAPVQRHVADRPEAHDLVLRIVSFGSSVTNGFAA